MLEGDIVAQPVGGGGSTANGFGSGTTSPGANGTISYPQYDAVGNRLQMTSTVNGILGATYSYNQNDELITDQFDANGNTTYSGE